jgi:hypothetical protein
MTEPRPNLPEEKGPVGKPSQAEGEDGPAPEQGGPQQAGKPSQAEGHVDDSSNRDFESTGSKTGFESTGSDGGQG